MRKSLRNQHISTHAPYTEGDLRFALSFSQSAYFNSRPLYRGRQPCSFFPFVNKIFQLTPPIQRATVINCNCSRFCVYFNSRPLYRGRHWNDTNSMQDKLFQLTPPIQRATIAMSNGVLLDLISTHAPYTEGDLERHQLDAGQIISTHAPYTEGDSKKQAI